jgi:hypothetical protein
MAESGAFAFGVVIGWFTYFTNRYRTAGLRKAADELTTAAGEVTSASDALATATTVPDRVTRVIGILKQTVA